MYKIKTLSVALFLFACSSASQAAHIISEFAADLSSGSYTSSAEYLPSSGTYSAENAFNGTGYWNAGNYGTHWIQADMGSIETLTQLKITIAQAPNGSTSHQVYLSDTFIGDDYTSLTAIYSHSGYTTHGTLLDILLTPQSGRYLQIVSHGGPSWTALGDDQPRIDWTQASVSAVPVPAALFMFAPALLGFLGFRRKTRA